MKKKITALLISCALVFCLFPAQSYAASDPFLSVGYSSTITESDGYYQIAP